MKIRCLLLCGLMLGNLVAFADDDLNNWGSSLNLGISKKICKGFYMSLSEEFRTRDDFAKVDRFAHELELSYKLFPHLKSEVSYQLINYNHPKKSWEIRHRLSFALTGSYKWDRLDFSLREKFQTTYREGVSATATRANPKQYLRSRLLVDYDIRASAISPYLSAELFHTLNNPVENILQRYRLEAGLDWRLDQNSYLQFYYRFTNYLDDADEPFGHLLGVGYLYKF